MASRCLFVFLEWIMVLQNSNENCNIKMYLGLATLLQLKWVKYGNKVHFLRKRHFLNENNHMGHFIKISLLLNLTSFTSFNTWICSSNSQNYFQRNRFRWNSLFWSRRPLYYNLLVEVKLIWATFFRTKLKRE